MGVVLSGDMGAPRRRELWIRVRRQLGSREMPPDGRPSPSDRERAVAMAWIERQFPHMGATEREQARKPGRGNQVAHELLFDSAPSGFPRSPRRLWRLRPKAYRNLLGAISGEDPDSFVEPFALNAPPGEFQDYAGLQRLDEPGLPLLIQNSCRGESFDLEGRRRRRRSSSGGTDRDSGSRGRSSH